MKAQTCPVCCGRGTVPQGFYAHIQGTISSSTAPDSCRSCYGRGVIFTPEPQWPHMDTPFGEALKRRQ